ncbi:MAG TPA: (Fe-S)-binding protein [Geobacteraceae bacterium]
MEHIQQTWSADDLPGLNCGLCGFRLCSEFALRLTDNPALVERCIHLADNVVPGRRESRSCVEMGSACGACGDGATMTAPVAGDGALWRDSLDREFDFYLEHFPEEPGPREIILPHNPLICRELELVPGDIVIGRPLGMSCGCPITHCGVLMEVDRRTGVLVWCVTGPLGPREKGFKDLGYYSAEGYEGMITQARVDIRIGMRYYFQPSMCMLQWRHSGLVNYLNRTPKGIQVRLEGLWIG